jgi:hypothetical protein
MGNNAAGNGDLCVWVKNNVKCLGGNRLVQNCEFYLVFYFSQQGMMSSGHFNFSATDARPKAITMNRVVKKVTSSFTFGFHYCNMSHLTL